MMFNLTYMIFNLFIPIQCETLSLTCIPIIFPSSVSFFHITQMIKYQRDFHQ